MMPFFDHRKPGWNDATPHLSWSSLIRHLVSSVCDDWTVVSQATLVVSSGQRLVVRLACNLHVRSTYIWWLWMAGSRQWGGANERNRNGCTVVLSSARLRSDVVDYIKIGVGGVWHVCQYYARRCRQHNDSRHLKLLVELLCPIPIAQ